MAADGGGSSLGMRLWRVAKEYNNKNDVTLHKIKDYVNSQVEPRLWEAAQHGYYFATMDIHNLNTLEYSALLNYLNGSLSFNFKSVVDLGNNRLKVEW